MKLLNQKNKISNKAFSLIELSVVILIIGILILGAIKGSDLYQEYRLQNFRKLTNDSPVRRISDLALWLETSNVNLFQNSLDLRRVKDGDKIKKWFDASLKNNGLHLLQDNESRMPSYVLNGINNLPSVKYDSTENHFLYNSLNDFFTPESTIFIVFTPVSYNLTINQSYLYVFGGSIAIESGYHSNYDLFTYIGGGSNISVSLIKNKANIYIRKYDPSNNSSSIRINNGNAVTSNATFSLPFQNPYLHLGNHGSAVRTFGGFFGEFIIFNRVLNDGEIKLVENYLKNKWDIVY